MRCVASVCPAVLGNNLEGDVLQTACQLHPQAKSGLPHDSEAIAFSVVIDAAILKIFQKVPNSYQAAPHSFAVRQQAAPVASCHCFQRLPANRLVPSPAP